ncbi:Flp pilus assembly protein CpaB [Phenylobacterium sp. J367]|uniref:Flp pilus assembly protein CpaB n=1 Tax=Phenylobacterium sp. J367 TaxID=2898435 RepID=UPI00215103B8|nr:Flp pilus assembly protein CpaB [Phenylobacterium sp. J367]MCR5878595.1 Flp pilus assembly protein CpaB [Phenylobacterium sp. J367]
MRVVTIISLGASAALGLAALVVAKTVLPSAAAKDAPAAVQPVQGVPVVVAAKPLKFGDRLDASALTIVRLPPNAVPEGAFQAADAVLTADKGGPPVVLVPIAAKEPMLAAKLSGPGARPSVAAEIADGMRAYTIKVDDVTGVGGHALPGDRVDVMLMRDLTPNSETRNFVSEVVLQNVRVLAVDLNLNTAEAKPATPNTATLEVAVQDGQKLAVAGDMGKLSLALRRTGSVEVAQTGPVRVGGGYRPAATQQAVVRRAAPRPARPAGPALIQIVEGESRGGARPAPRPAPAAPAAPAPAPTAD